MDIAVKKFFNENKVGQLFTYDEFMDYSVNKIENSDSSKLVENELTYYNYSKLNLHRVNRIKKTFKPDSEFLNLVEKIDEKQTWLVITEDWCGDSAQNLPYIYEHIKTNPNIQLFVLLRDSNLDVIDNYFKEGNPRSIPKIVAFDESGGELFIWGPRPKIAQDLVQQLKAEGYSKDEFNKELHLWYAKNKGQELLREFSILLKK